VKVKYRRKLKENLFVTSLLGITLNQRLQNIVTKNLMKGEIYKFIKEFTLVRSLLSAVIVQ